MLAAIETSFDDSGIAIGRLGGELLAARLNSQSAAHAPFSGVVPELAARTHLSNLPGMWRELTAGLSQSPTAIGITAGPGLPGSLLTGVNFARGLAAWYGAELYGLNHLEGHIYSPFMPAAAGAQREIPFPHLALLVSGGHTELFLVSSLWDCRLLAQTRDDAVGELLDKVSALLGHGYPGGARLEQLALESGCLDSEGHYLGEPLLPVPLRGSKELAFSYSGLKTAVVRQVRRAQESDEGLTGAGELRLLACLFSVVLDSLWDRIRLALEDCSVRAVCVSGGVAINSLLRRRFEAECGRMGLECCFPQPRHCLDNAEMMLWLLSLKLLSGVRPAVFDIQSNWLPG